jgi:hypothetical protein
MTDTILYGLLFIIISLTLDMLFAKDLKDLKMRIIMTIIITPLFMVLYFFISHKG